MSEKHHARVIAPNESEDTGGGGNDPEPEVAKSKYANYDSDEEDNMGFVSKKSDRGKQHTYAAKFRAKSNLSKPEKKNTDKRLKINIQEKGVIYKC